MKKNGLRGAGASSVLFGSITAIDIWSDDASFIMMLSMKYIDPAVNDNGADRCDSEQVYTLGAHDPSILAMICFEDSLPLLPK